MIRDNIGKIQARLTASCARVKRDPGSVTIVAVSKNRAAEEIQEAVAAGITDIGENKVQEALDKYKELSTISYQLLVNTDANRQRLFSQYYELKAEGCKLKAVKWHMVGHLQTNKVKEAVRIFDLIQSVDSLRLAQEIDKQAAKINKIQDILLEVKTSPEATKFGLKPEEAASVVKEITGLKNINLKGLMTIAPLVDNPENARPYFRMLRELRNKLSTINYQLSTLSMGMTEDFEVAIEEGANMVRLGRAVFE